MKGVILSRREIWIRIKTLSELRVPGLPHACAIQAVRVESLVRARMTRDCPHSVVQRRKSFRLGVPSPGRRTLVQTLFGAVLMGCGVLPGQAAPSASVARVWNEEVLSAIRIDLPHPPVHARNLFHLSVAMYDAWAAYDPVAVGYLYREKHGGGDVEAARREAISYAAYRLLSERYARSRNASNTLAALEGRMADLGYDRNNLSLDPSSPAGVGNRVVAVVSAFAAHDGALQDRAYQDVPPQLGGYVPTNAPLLTMASGTRAVDPNRWQPLAFTNAVSQNNIPVDLIQKFLGAQWIEVRPFAMVRENSTAPWVDPGPPPRLGGAGDAQYRNEAVDVIRRSSELSPDDGVVIDISPAVFGNNSPGANDGTGRPLNPATGQPYPPNLVKRGDFARVLAEFWADGPNSETPPGHWNVIANQVSDAGSVPKRLGGTGLLVNDLEWDVKLYFALNAAVHDAACAAWSLKRYYDGWRPIEAIRYMGQRGQSSLDSDPTYDPAGLPLVPGLIEIVTGATAATGGRHAGLPVGTIAILAWPGQPDDVFGQHSGVRWIRAADWLPYQKRTFVTPAFPGYISGHSTFSRAAAEVLAAITGTEFFPGGLGTFTAPAGTGLSIEYGPSQRIQLQWATYFDAADQAGLSRLWGGIHVSVDDLAGRRVGAQCGRGAWVLAQQYFDGSIAAAPVSLALHRLPSGKCEVRAATRPGFSYSLESTADLAEGFSSEAGGTLQATEHTLSWIRSTVDTQRFYRVLAH